MSALTEIMHDLFAPRPKEKTTLGDAARSLGCLLVLAVMFVAMVAPWFVGAWAIIKLVFPTDAA